MQLSYGETHTQTNLNSSDRAPQRACYAAGCFSTMRSF